MIRIKTTVGLVTAFLSILVNAQGVSYDQSIDCERVEKEGGSNYEMGQCAGRARLEIEAQLNRVYGQLRSQLKGTEDEKVLVEAQRAWILWKDKEANLCARASGFSPKGSGYGMVWASCVSALTGDRAKSLRSYLR